MFANFIYRISALVSFKFTGIQCGIKISASHKQLGGLTDWRIAIQNEIEFMDEYMTRIEATEFLGITTRRFQELLNGNRLNPILSRTYPNPRKPGKFLEENPNNEEWYSMNDLRELKLSLAAEGVK